MIFIKVSREVQILLYSSRMWCVFDSIEGRHLLQQKLPENNRKVLQKVCVCCAVAAQLNSLSPTVSFYSQTRVSWAESAEPTLSSDVIIRRYWRHSSADSAAFIQRSVTNFLCYALPNEDREVSCKPISADHRAVYYLLAPARLQDN